MTPRSAPDTPPDSIATLAELFRWRVARTPDTDAYLRFEPTAALWLQVSWREMAARVDRVTGALSALDLPREARIALLLPNGLDAVAVDQAALALACVPVPMHALDNPASIAYILADSDAAVLVVQTDTQWQAIVDTGTPLPALKQVVILQRGIDTPVSDHLPVIRRWDAWLANAGAPVARPPRPDELAALVYTSGTTGKPKGVMLTHDNVLENVKAVLQRVTPEPGDRFLSFLPLSHTFERTAGYYLPIAAGSCVAHARSTALLAEDLLKVRPTLLISVPRIYERFYSAIQGALASSPAKARLFALAQEVGWRRFCRAQGLPVAGRVPAFADDLLWRVLDGAVARPIRERFGGKLRLAISGGAALPPAIAHCFLGLGVTVLQGYGMTETSPVVSANAPDDNDPSTIGKALPGVSVRLGENRELQVRGRNVMRGYWKRDEDTAAAFIDGWLRTGDQAEILLDGRIRILGRIKEIIVTSTGEKIAPADLEQAITADPLFEQAYVFGDNRPFIAAIVVLGLPGWKKLASSLGLNPADPASLDAATARETALQRIRALTHAFPYYAQPRAVALTLEPWTPESTLLTPTLKLKRKNLAAHFAGVIDSLYRR